MTDSDQPKRKLISKRLSDILYQILSARNEPIEISKLEEMALAIAAKKGYATNVGGKNLYILAKTEESYFVIDEYPSYKLRSNTRLPEFSDIDRGVKYPAAAAKVLITSRNYVDLMEIVETISRKKLYQFPVSYPEYWMYWYLNEYREIFSRSGALKVGLKEWRGEKDFLNLAQENVSHISSSRMDASIDVTPKLHEANLESILVEQLDAIEEGLQLVKRQFVCSGVGRIDLLCKDRKGNLVVIELKKFGVKHDSIIDQIARYMGYVKAHVAKGNQKVRGIIVVGKVDERLHYAVSAFPSIEVKTFNLTIS